jgi:hypothetical protein
MDYVKNLRDALKSATHSNVSNEQIAMINAMAYRSKVKQNLSKKLDKRIIKNQNLTN